MQKRFTAQRREQLAQMVLEKGHVAVTDAANALSVSTETIRKDIIELDKLGLVMKSRGGAMRVNGVQEKPLVKKSMDYPHQKNVIARYVTDMVPDGATLILDAGSTTTAVAELLALRSGLTIFTNSAPAIGILAPSDNDVFILGGRIRHSSLATVGEWVSTELATIQADIALLGADSVDSFSGPTTNSYGEVAVKRSMVAAAKHRILMADSSKFTLSGSFQFCTWDQIDCLVTDGGVDQGAVENLAGIVQVDVARE